MTLRDRIKGHVEAADAKHASDSASAKSAIESMNAKREEEALSTAIAMLEEETIEQMVKLTLSRPALGRHGAFGITGNTLQAVRLEGKVIHKIQGLSIDFPYNPDPMAFRRAVQHDLVQARKADLAKQGVKIDFPDLQVGSNPVILVDFRQV